MLLQEISADSLTITLLNDKLTFADSVELLFLDKKFSLKLKNYDEIEYIPISKNLFKSINGAPFQIVFFANFPSESEVNFRMDFYKEQTLYYSVSSLDVNEDGNYLSPAVIRVYTNFQKRNTLLIKKNGSLEIPTNIELNSKIRITFSINSSNFSQTSIHFLGTNLLDTLLTIKADRHSFPQLLPDDNVENLNNIFLAPNLWNSFTVIFDENKIKLSINDEVIAEKTDGTFNNEISQISFVNRDTSKLYISQIKLFADSHKVFSEGIADSLVEKIDFSDLENIEQISDLALHVNNAEIVEKEIPVTTFPPKIDISISSAYSTIEWYNNKDRNIKKYVLQKSTDYKDFINIYTVENPEISRRYSYQNYNLDDNKVIFFRVKQVDNNGVESYSSQVKIGHAKIEDFELKQNYPNPFNPTTAITVKVIIPGYYLIGVYDLVGKEIQILHEGTLSIGSHNFEFNAEDLPSGIYLLKVKSSNMSVVRKMILTK